MTKLLRSDDAWKGRWQFNEFLQRNQMLNGHNVFEPISDLHVLQIQEAVQLGGYRGAKKEVLRDALDIVCHEHPYHPICSWLNAEHDDKIPRMSHWLVDCLGAEDTPYNRAIGRMFIIAMVARVMQPGCRADYMLILEGPQGIQKSHACRILAGAEYFDDHVPLMERDPVRASMALRGKWLMEVAEMDSFNRWNIDNLKAFVTRTTENFTPKFGRAPVSEPRQCLFIGTTNREDYLVDVTGGRRFWPVRCGEIDIERLAAMRNKLFAEAVTAYRNGEHWWPDAEFEAEHIKPEQEERQQPDAWIDDIRPWLLTRSQVTLMQVWKECISTSNGDATNYHRHQQVRVADCLRQLGWEPGRRLKQAQLWVEKPKP